MKSDVKISIITINYNNLEGLKRTVKSVVNQTWHEFEYIVIDGGSNDGSVQYLETESDKIDYLLIEKDSGIYNAMNKGIKVATGDYLLFLNSGDHFFNKKVMEQNHLFLEEYDLVYFDLNIVSAENIFVKIYQSKLGFSYFLNETLPHPATFIRRSLFDTVGLYDESLKIVSDWKFFLNAICKYNSSYFKINNVLSTFYMDGLSSNPSNEYLIQLEKETVLFSDFNAYLDDYSQLSKYRINITTLKKSIIIRILIKLRIINSI